MSPPTDRSVLSGVLALQMRFIDREGLVAAMNECARREGKSIEAILVEHGALTEDERKAVEIAAEQHIERHGDAKSSLTALGVDELLREVLASAADADDEASLYETLPARARAVAAPSLGRVGEATSERGRFQILRSHARGGLGEVFVARDAELNRQVAVKEIRREYADDTDLRARFVLEAEITGRLEHPAVVPVYGFGRCDDGRPFYAMRFVRGRSLKQAIDQFYADDGARKDASKQSLELRKKA